MHDYQEGERQARAHVNGKRDQRPVLAVDSEGERAAGNTFRVEVEVPSTDSGHGVARHQLKRARHQTRHHYLYFFALIKSIKSNLNKLKLLNYKLPPC